MHGDAQAPAGQYTIALAEGGEDSELLKLLLMDANKDMIDMSINGIIVGNTRAPVTFKFSSDWKFMGIITKDDGGEPRLKFFLIIIIAIALVLGKKAASADECCLLCSSSKATRQDMKAVHASLESYAPTDKGMKGESLLTIITPRNVILDRLHWILRVTDQVWAYLTGMV